MNKFLVLTVFGLVLCGGMVFADDDQGVTGSVDANIVIEVTPETLNFEAIPYGDAVDHSGFTVSVDATGSDVVAPETVQIEVTVSADTDDFYYELMEYETSEEIWAGFDDVGGVLLSVSTDEIATFDTRIFGDTASKGPGTKTATLMYTISGETP